MSGWSRRTAVLIGDELVITKVRVVHDHLSILVNSEKEEWSEFNLKRYEVSFLKHFKYKLRSGESELPDQEQPALMILYEPSGVIGMSIVLKDHTEMDLLFHDLRSHTTVHTNVIPKNTYVEEKFANLTIDNFLPSDYFDHGYKPRDMKGHHHEVPVSSGKFKHLLDLINDIKTKKVFLDWVKGCQVFGVVRCPVEFEQKDTQYVPREMPSSITMFIKGYFKKMWMQYDISAMVTLVFIYSSLVYLSVFTFPQLIVFSICVIFAVAKFDLHLAKIRQAKAIINVKEVEVYVKKMISFSRPELSEYLSERTKKVRLHAINARSSLPASDYR